MKKVIVTGGAGFIGSHLTEELVNSDYNVTVIDNLSTGKVEHISSLVKSGKAELIEGSITDLPFLKKVFQQADIVVHWTWASSAPSEVKNSILAVTGLPLATSTILWVPQLRWLKATSAAE
ncbi:NAD-dependent epimerase/dehydratase family protein [Chloroflexota bacterium]